MAGNESGFEKVSGGLTSQTAYVYDGSDVAVGSVSGVFFEGVWTFYDENADVYELPVDHYLVWKTEGVALQPADPTIRCYFREVPVSEPTSKPNNVANKGYIKQTLWTVAQFVNSGNVGSSDADFHALVVTDDDGVPTVNGEYVQSDVTTMTRNESGANGELIRYEGYLYSPIRYPDTAAGKYVTKAELVDSYTGTTQADYSQLFVASDSGVYTLSRGDLALVDDNPAAGDSIYTFNPAQRGRWMRFAYVNGDMGGASQFNLQMRLTYTDGSIQTIALVNFLHQVGVIAYHAETTVESLVFDTVAGTWTKDGAAETVDTGLGNLSEAVCGQLPISFNVWSEAGTVAFSGVFGGSQSGYEYSIDGGVSFQASPNFDLSEVAAREVVPVVRDSNGSVSAKAGLASHVPCVDKAWAADLLTPAVNDTAYDDGAGNRGWGIVYSTELGSQLESSASALSWSLDRATQDTNYIYLGNTFVSPEASAEADLTPVLSTTVSGHGYVLAFSPYNYYHGAAGTTSTFRAEIVDNVTSNVLGFKEFVWNGQTTVNLADQLVEFVGSGNSVSLRFEVINAASISGNWWGSTTSVTSTADSIQKTNGTGFNVGVRSAVMGSVADGVNLKFKRDGAGNIGMHGLDSDYVGTSYGGVDYSFYVSSASNFNIYEDGSSRFSGTYTGGNNAVFEIDIATDGTVTYKVNGTTVYTSTVNAGSASYWVASHPYTNAMGIKDVVFDGSDPVKVPDVASQYIRIDNVRLFDGQFSDASHYAKKQGSYLFFRGISGEAVYVSDVHGYGKDVTVIPKFDIRKYGTLEKTVGDVDRVVLEYQIGSGGLFGSWVTMLDHEGDFDAANLIYLSPFYFDKGVVLAADESIRYRMTVFGTGNNNEGYQLYENSEVVRC